jgi:hypothetical protein
MGTSIHYVLRATHRGDKVLSAMVGRQKGFGRMRLPGLLVVAVLAGCTTNIEPSASELKARWDAENVFPQRYRQDLLAFLRTYLNDPSHIRGAGVSQPQLKYIGPGDRYVACVRYDSRNTDGKYLGSKDGAAIFVGGKLDRFLDTPREVRELCKEVAYAAFPELERLTR